MKHFIYLIVIGLLPANQTKAQCFVNETETNIATAYTNKAETIYKNGNLKITLIVEKIVYNNSEKAVYNVIFNVSGYISNIVIPDIAEITTNSGKVIYLYIPKRSAQVMLSNMVSTDCYGKFSETSQEIQALLSERATTIKLKNDEKSVTFNLSDYSLFQKMINCLISK